MSNVTVSVRVAPVYCGDCGAEFHIVPSIESATEGKSVECGVSDFTAFQHLIFAVQGSLPGHLQVGALKVRFSKT